MRPIKFRAFWKDSTMKQGIMLEALKLIRTDDGKDWYWQSEVQFTDGKTATAGGIGGLMQFTGLTDKNGKEIYEGDIVQDITDQFIHSPNEPVLHLCRFDDGWAGFDFKCLNGSGGYEVDKNMKADASEKFEVIGNKYENPELLK